MLKHLLSILLLLILSISANAQSEVRSVYNHPKQPSTYTLSRGKLEGPFVQYYPNGLLQSEGIVSGTKRTGTNYYYGPDDSLVQKVEYTFTFPKIGNFQGSSLQERITCYGKEGQVQSVRKYINGREVTGDGNILLYDNGQLQAETQLGSDSRHYTSTTYFENGQTERLVSYYLVGNDQVYDSLQETWDESGQLLGSCNFNLGERHGVCRSWSPQGILIAEDSYRHGKLLYYKRWNEAGQVLESFDARQAEIRNVKMLYQQDQRTLSQKRYERRIVLDGDTIWLHYTERYDAQGQLTHTSVYSDRPGPNVSYGLQESFNENAIGNATFQIACELTPAGDTILRFSARGREEQLAFKIDRDVILPFRHTAKQADEALHKALQYAVSKRGEKGRKKQVAFDRSLLPAAEAYYQSIARQTFFTGGSLTSELDSTMTGPYAITYAGTHMRLEGYLVDGLKHGTFILYLNDSTLLFRREYRFGREHGPATEWYINGNIADERIFYFGKITHRTAYYLNGGKQSYNEAGPPELKDEWYPNGRIKHFTVCDGKTTAKADLDSTGKVTTYSWNDGDQLHFGRGAYRGRPLTTIHLPTEATETYTYTFEKYGTRITGKAYWDPIQKVRVLEDNIDVPRTRIDRAFRAFSPALPCQCEEWVGEEFFRLPLSEHVSKFSFNRFQFNFHEPLENFGDLYGDPYYPHKKPKVFIPGKEYNVDDYLFTYREIQFVLPDPNGLRFSISPCKSKHAFVNYGYHLSFRAGLPAYTKLTLYQPNSLSLAFNAGFLHQLDDRFQSLKDSADQLVPALFLFRAEQIIYDRKKELDVIHPYLSCARPCALNNTSLIIHAEGLLPDLSTTFNYPEMISSWKPDSGTADPRFRLLHVPARKLDKFRGAFLTRSTVYLPLKIADSTVYLLLTGKDIALGSDFVLGTLSVEATSGPDGLYTLRDQQDEVYALTRAEFEKLWKSSGVDQYNLQYDQASGHMLIHFYYTSK
jgi:antitoxin component YwqK of YwqJK toxin-antitoxin module